MDKTSTWKWHDLGEKGSKFLVLSTQIEIDQYLELTVGNVWRTEACNKNNMFLCWIQLVCLTRCLWATQPCHSKATFCCARSATVRSIASGFRPLPSCPSGGWTFLKGLVVSLIQNYLGGKGRESTQRYIYVKEWASWERSTTIHDRYMSQEQEDPCVMILRQNRVNCRQWLWFSWGIHATPIIAHCIQITWVPLFPCRSQF